MKPMVFLLVMAGFLAGCGQKGPLYREVPTDNNTATEQADNSEQNSDKQAEDRY